MDTVSRIDVVVVAYQSRDELPACVAPLAGKPGIRVVVVDNASPDRGYEAVEGIPGVDVLRMPLNGGFAYGCNAGWRRGDAPFVLFLNPDARIDAGQLERLVAELEAHPAAGAMGPRIEHDDGSLDYSVRRFPALRTTYAQALLVHRLLPRASWTDELVRDPAAYDVTGAVDWLSGACLLVRRDVLERIGGWDEGFFLYSEDIDICRRIRDAGLDVLFTPAATCRHVGGASHPRSALLPVLAASRLRYARKHRSAVAARLEQLGIAVGELVHGLVGRGGADMRRGHLRAAGVALRGEEAHRPTTGGSSLSA